MLNFGASKPRVGGDLGPWGSPGSAPVGRSELRWDFWTIYKDDCDILGFCWNFSIKKLHFCPQEVLIMSF